MTQHTARDASPSGLAQRHSAAKALPPFTPILHPVLAQVPAWLCMMQPQWQGGGYPQQGGWQGGYPPYGHELPEPEDTTPQHREG